jgi:hypothetical protein
MELGDVHLIHVVCHDGLGLHRHQINHFASNFPREDESVRGRADEEGKEEEGSSRVKMVLNDSIVADSIANQSVSRGVAQTRERTRGKGQQTSRWGRA